MRCSYTAFAALLVTLPRRFADAILGFETSGQALNHCHKVWF